MEAGSVQFPCETPSGQLIHAEPATCDDTIAVTGEGFTERNAGLLKLCIKRVHLPPVPRQVPALGAPAGTEGVNQRSVNGLSPFSTTANLGGSPIPVEYMPALRIYAEQLVESFFISLSSGNQQIDGSASKAEELWMDLQTGEWEGSATQLSICEYLAHKYSCS